MHACETGQLRAVTDGEIERIAVELRAVERKSAWGRTQDIGRLVLEGLFAGDEAAWRSRSRSKDLSLRRLVQHPKCVFKKTALSDAVGIYLFVKDNASVLELKALTPTHVLQVLRLPQPVALSLLGQASERGASVRELRAEAHALRRQSGERRGRPPSPLERKAETFARRAARQLTAILAQLAQGPPLDDEACTVLGAALDQLAEVVESARLVAYAPLHKALRVMPKPNAPTEVPLLGLGAS
ncbi:MAG TPA: hypothetical protein VGJ91_00835 [Polyangiaceae bacterium]|jgi:hypothetical protein